MEKPVPKTQVLIDTDADFDDYMAMLYLLKHPDISVKGITVTGTGDVHLTPGTINVSNMLTLLDDEAALKIPVVRGAKAPMSYSNTFPGVDRNAADQHNNVPFPGTNPNPPLADAQDFLRDYFINSTVPTTVLCIGGGSNWGRLFECAKTDTELRAALSKNLEHIVMMGGNLLPCFVKPGAEGNLQATMGESPYYTNKVAEWNIFIDPRGAQEIFSSGTPITLVALNATSQVPITTQFAAQLAQINNPVATFLTQVLASDTINQGIGKYLDFWDPLAACVLVDPTLVTAQTFVLRIEQELDEEDDKSGMLIVDENNGHAVNVALTANPQAVYQTFLNIIAR
ncbi:nucleoside hydrolase [Nitrosovibrio sp. Nv6]|uniref:nucleoside hydrolase n=1 Tax=Nitrosovibrio sp. Nv6 TaxID=1855340 RepID=UPI0008B20CA1|nr:nucleoside hydrolase [Nitrosovibrio sp. Nv6]SEP36694.1 purine nucleosidase/pyrimidine-specific ribonucleoside hydrolase [Nitrosovibrio sp. Nv6]